MDSRLRTLTAIGFFVVARFGWAEPMGPPRPPAGTTAVCNDGSYSSSADRRGACRGHRGIRTWIGPGVAAADRSDDASGPARDSAPADGPDQEGADAPRPAGPVPDRVWVNDNTRVYHCPGDPHYGKTAKGGYLSESDARRKGYHANQGKGCAEPDR